MQRNGDPVVLCFVDFENPACAATARTALQGKLRFSLLPNLVNIRSNMFCFISCYILYLHQHIPLFVFLKKDTQTRT